MPNRTYWQKRFEMIEKSSVSKGLNYYETLDKEFRKAEKKIQAKIDIWYQRFANNNEISLSEARKLLNSGELEELKWSVEEYIKHSQENAFTQEWMKELENASAKVHISRLEALKLQIQQEAEVLYGNQLDGVDKLARDIYTDTYYHTAFEIQKGFNVGWDFQRLDSRLLNKVITKPWTADGKTFSEKIWTQKNDLISTLHTELTQAILRGDAPDNAIKAIANKFKVSKNKAGRLVMTESAYFSSVAQKDCFNELDVERFEIVATLDSHTSELCQSLDGKVQDMKDFEPGVTAPPFHPWCRTTTVPYFDDDEGYRAARGADGKEYYVPSNMTYKEWASKYVIDANYGQYGYMTPDAEQFERYKKVLKEISPDTLTKFKEIKYNDADGWKTLKRNYRIVNQYEINSGDLTAQQILDLDNKIITEKRNNFPSAYKTSGNIAGAFVDTDSKLFLTHSKIDSTNDKGFKNYKGTNQIVPLQEKRVFKYIDVEMPDGSMRGKTYLDTEAKLFEKFHVMYRKGKKFKTITMLSERGMCKSCKNVMNQFKKMHPDVEINVVSNKKVNSDVWKRRRKGKKNDKS